MLVLELVTAAACGWPWLHSAADSIAAGLMLLYLLPGKGMHFVHCDIAAAMVGGMTAQPRLMQRTSRFMTAI